MKTQTIFLLAAGLLGISLSAAAAPSAGPSGYHTKMGLPCSVCHGAGKERQTPAIEQCTVCHKTEQLVKKTAGVKPQNPHTSPHYQDKLECTNCHQEHGGSENYCAQCHSFDFKVP